jgi:hypothetical protein
MARDGLKLPKESLGPAMPYPSTPYGRGTPETALQPFQGWPVHGGGGLQPSSTPLDTPCRTPLFTGLNPGENDDVIHTSFDRRHFFQYLTLFSSNHRLSRWNDES